MINTWSHKDLYSNSLRSTREFSKTIKWIIHKDQHVNSQRSMRDFKKIITWIKKDQYMNWWSRITQARHNIWTHQSKFSWIHQYQHVDYFKLLLSDYWLVKHQCTFRFYLLLMQSGSKGRAGLENIIPSRGGLLSTEIGTGHVHHSAPDFGCRCSCTRPTTDTRPWGISSTAL